MFNIESYREINDIIRKTTKKSTKLVAVSKNHAKSDVLQAIDAGVAVFGENRVQEAQGKFESIKNRGNIELHITGPLQTNKVKQALNLFDVFQTLDREKLAKEFAKYSDLINKKKFFIQVNTGKESSKSGIYPEETPDFISYCVTELKMPIIGLMCIPPFDEKAEPHFNLLKKIADENHLEDLSMGMSGDFEEAIMCGATYIRVGTRLFGKRNEL